MHIIRRFRKLIRKTWLSTQRQTIVLLYHRVARIESDPYFLNVTPEHFAEHLEHIRKFYKTMNLLELSRCLRKKSIPHKTVVITFDDGYVDNFYNATPLLERHDIPATLFLSTGYIGQDREFWWDELERILLLPVNLPNSLELSINSKLYKWNLQDDNKQDFRHKAFKDLYNLLRNLEDSEQQKALSVLAQSIGVNKNARPGYRPLNFDELKILGKNELIDIGSHTITHPLLSSQTLDVQRREIFASKKNLEEILNRPVNIFSYPYGGANEVNEYTIQLVREAGYDVACSTISSPVTRYSIPYWLPRCIAMNWNGEEFAKKIEQFFEVNENTALSYRGI